MAASNSSEQPTATAHSGASASGSGQPHRRGHLSRLALLGAVALAVAVALGDGARQAAPAEANHSPAAGNVMTIFHNQDTGTCTPGPVPSCTVLDPGPAAGSGGPESGNAGPSILNVAVGDTFKVIVSVTSQSAASDGYQWQLAWENSQIDVVSDTPLDTSLPSCGNLAAGDGSLETYTGGCGAAGSQMFVNPVHEVTLQCVLEGGANVLLRTLEDDPDFGTSLFAGLSPLPTATENQLPLYGYTSPTYAAISVYCGNVPSSELIVNSDANTSDGLCSITPGGCTLREAIDAANTNPSFDYITFDIPPAGPHTIDLNSGAGALPTLTGNSMALLGWTQPGFAPNFRPIIRIDGANTVATGLHVNGCTAGGSMISDLSVTRFTNAGILLDCASTNGSQLVRNYLGIEPGGASAGNGYGVLVYSDFNLLQGNVIAGNGYGVSLYGGSNNLLTKNYIGTDPSGRTAMGNAVGIFVGGGASANTIGGGNLISGNASHGIHVEAGATTTTIVGNTIGADVTTGRPLSNSGHGILLEGGGNLVGLGGDLGSSEPLCAGDCNIIASSAFSGVAVLSDANQVYGNHIGTDRTGTVLLSNGGEGVYVAGSNNWIDSNLIRFNTYRGIFVSSGTANGLLNRLLSNGPSGGGLGIDLAPDGVNSNDAGDGDSGPNNKLNFPVISTVTQGAGTLTITGSLDVPAGPTYYVDFWGSPSCDASGNGEGRTAIGFGSTTGGAFSFVLSGPMALKGGRAITATTTDDLPLNPRSTSEFSACFLMPPCSGDDDCDGFANPAATLAAGPANTNTTVDNCPSDWNNYQLNSDANFVDQSPPKTIDDKTWVRSDVFGDECDPDDDGDGLADLAEYVGCNGSGQLNPLERDTDLDRFLDGIECTLGTNPGDINSKPALTACGATGDSDGDRLTNRIEVCNYNSDPNNTDTDGDMALDGAKDGCEVASLNADRVVNAGDQLLLAAEIVRPPPRLVNFDLNKDGSVSSGDQLLMAFFISPPGQCP
jgi:CSLREA domain-containing protein